MRRVLELETENERLRELMRKTFNRCADVGFDMELPREFCEEALRGEGE